MAVYLVAFTLNTPGSDPIPVIEGIKKLGSAWMCYMPNVVLIQSKEDANTIAQKVYKMIHKPDYLLVVKITNEHQGWLPAEAWKWLNQQQYS